MQGLMMDMPLLISGLIQYAADYHGETEVVAREIEGDIHRYSYAAAHPRIKRMALALKRLGLRSGDRVGTLAWNTHRHWEMFYAAPGMGYVLHTINPRLSPGRDRCWIQLAFFRREIGIDDLLHVRYDRQSKGSRLFTQGGAVADHDLFEPRLPARAS